MPDQVLYALISRGSTVLAEHSDVTGNANLVAHRILEKLPQYDSRSSFSQDRHLFHIVTSNGITYMCMADEGLGRRVPFGFLEDVRERFSTAYGSEADHAVAYEYNTDFSVVLRDRMRFFNEPQSDAMKRMRGEISDVKNIMIDNIEKVLDRGERIELLVDKTDHLQGDSFAFKRQARTLKRRMWWKNGRLVALIAILLLALTYAIIAVFCSPTFQC